VVDAVTQATESVDAIVLDLPDHPSAIAATAGLLNNGGRLACYCPVTSQLERAWEACEAAGLTVEWAGELMEREWGRASKGGMRPVNGPFGHTAFLLVAQRT
jgi:tRNA A58 N-methylase Trm61